MATEIKFTGKEFICDSCDYLWVSKKRFGEPGKCPKCNSKNIRCLTKEQFTSFIGKNIDRYGNIY